MTELIKYIENEIIVTSGDAIKFCVKSLGISNEAARKRIQRLPSNIRKIKGICRERQSILYHEKNWMNPDFSDQLVEIIRNHATQHYAILNALNIHYGVIPNSIFAEYTFSPVGNVKGHKKFSSIIDDLKRLQLIDENENTYISSECQVYNDKKSKAINVIHKLTISHFHEWGRNIGLFSYDSASFHSELSSYQFAIVAPTYLNSLTSISKKGKTIPAFIVVDIILNRDIKSSNIDYFIKKIENVSSRIPNTKIIPFLLIGTHDQDIYQALKSKGIIVGNIDELFGNKYSESVYGILNLIENAGAILKKNPAQYLKLIGSIESLSKGKTYNLKGDLFEMAVGYYHGQFCQSLEVSKNIIYDTDTREIDVYAVYQDKVVFSECKGYNSKIDIDYIEKWLSEIIPTFRKWIQSTYPQRECEFQIWSIGGFDDKSISLLETHKQSSKKYSLNYYCKSDILKIAQDSNDTTFIKQINKHFSEY